MSKHPFSHSLSDHSNSFTPPLLKHSDVKPSNHYTFPTYISFIASVIPLSLLLFRFIFQQRQPFITCRFPAIFHIRPLFKILYQSSTSPSHHPTVFTIHILIGLFPCLLTLPHIFHLLPKHLYFIHFVLRRSSPSSILVFWLNLFTRLFLKYSYFTTSSSILHRSLVTAFFYAHQHTSCHIPHACTSSVNLWTFSARTHL